MLLAAGGIAVLVALTLGAWWGAGVAAAGLTLVSLRWRRGVAQSVEAVEWHQGVEPLAWALYYGVQQVQRLLSTIDDLRDAPDKSLKELEDEIEYDEDEVPLPGQEQKIEALAEFLYVRRPLLAVSFDASRLVAATLSDRAPAAAELAAGAARRQLGRTRATASQADALGDRIYHYLLDESTSFVTHPRPRLGPEGTLRELADDPAVQSLATKGRELVSVADAAAKGHWPPPVEGRWERPRRRGWAAASLALGAALFAAGLYLTTRGDDAQRTGAVLMTVGTVLVPGTIGKVAKELIALRIAKPGAA